MPMNRVQFQPGLSMPEFFRQFGTEAQCEAALERTRWPEGFRCPHCGQATHYVLRIGMCEDLPMRWLPKADFADRRHAVSGHQAGADGMVLGHLPD